MAGSMPTTKDVARLAGVSVATVSYVLNGRRNGNTAISEATRKKVLDAVAQLGYSPNQAARHLRRQRTEQIGIVLPGLGIPFNDVLCRDIERVAAQHSYSVIISLARSREQEFKVLAQLQRRPVDGAVLVHSQADSEALSPLVRAGLALVVISNSVTGQGFDVERTTEIEAFRELMHYLLAKGHRRIAFLEVGQNEEEGKEGRYTCYRQALNDWNIDFDERLVEKGAAQDVRNEAYKRALRLLQQPEGVRPDAIFTASDAAGIATIWAAQALGLRVPEDVAVFGTGNIPEGKITNPPLSTAGPVSMDFSYLGEMLFDRLQNPDREDRVTLRKWDLILRGSA